MPLTTKEFSHIARALNTFRFGVLKDARTNLSIKKRRTSPNPNRGSYTSKIDNTGDLSRSMKSRRKNLNITFTLDEYGFWVDQGRKAGGKQPPPKVIIDWIKQKPIRLRDEKGRFGKKTPAKINSLAFLIGRSMAKYGTKKTRFFSEPFEKRFNKLGDDIREAMMKDLNLYFLR